MRFGAMTLPNVPWPKLVDRWHTLDDLGFDSIWVADHLVSPIRAGETWLEGWSCLAGMASVTTRARIGTLVSPLTYRNPAVLAKAAVTVDHASGGRLELGVGAGGSQADRELTGLTPTRDEVRTRFARVRQLLDDPTLEPRPAQARIPLTIGGESASLLRAAAALADRWNVHVRYGTSLEDGLREARERNERLDELCAELGRDPQELLRSAHLGYRFVGEEPWASEEAFATYVRSWRDAGFEELILFYLPHVGLGDAAVCERIVRTVLPELH